MPFYPAFLEFIGTTEMLVIAVVALVIFGPRRLPEIGRTIGKSLSEFKRASDDFKRTWEREVEFERIEQDLKIPSINVEARPVSRGGAASAADAGPVASVPAHPTGADAEPLADGASAAPVAAAEGAGEETPTPASSSKHDWL
jgi:Tat protein translocase TatB subunit